MGNDIIFFVKFSERKYLESLKKGNIYFSNAKTFIELEKEQLKRGQGDRAEGRIGFNSVKAELKNRYTNEVVACFNNIDILTSFEGVDTMPVFCITAGRKKDCSEYKNENDYTIKFSEEVKRTITEDFPNADSAIIISQPKLFIQDVKRMFNNKCKHDLIRYFNINDCMGISEEMIEFLLDIQLDTEGLTTSASLTKDNIYKVLYCKDKYFKEQNEYRFVAHKNCIYKPTIYKFRMNSKSYIYPINDLFTGVKINN